MTGIKPKQADYDAMEWTLSNCLMDLIVDK